MHLLFFFLSMARADIELAIEVPRIESSKYGAQAEVTRSQMDVLAQGGQMSLPKLVALTTPGVVQGPFGQMFFRGNHASVQYVLDGIPMPDMPTSSFGQLMSPQHLASVHVLTGGLSAFYGQRLSAVIEMETKRDQTSVEGDASIGYGSYNAATPQIAVRGKNGALRYFTSVSAFTSQRGLDTPQPMTVIDQRQGTSESIHNTSFGGQELCKLDWTLHQGAELGLLYFGAQSQFQIPNYPSRFLISSPFFGPGFTDSFGNTGGDQPTYNYKPAVTNDRQEEMSHYVQLGWKKEQANLKWTVVPYVRSTRLIFQADPKNDLYAATRIPNSIASSFAMDRLVLHAGLRTDVRWSVFEAHQIKFGAMVQRSTANGAISIQTASMAPQSIGSPEIGYVTGVYLEDETALFSWMQMRAGVRYDYAFFSLGSNALTSKEALFSPRLGFHFVPGEGIEITLAYSKLFQPAPLESLRYEFQTGQELTSFPLRAEKDDMIELGFKHQVTRSLSYASNVYYRRGVDILDEAELLGTSLSQPYNFATGFAYGAEVSSLLQFLNFFSLQARYSYTMAQGKEGSGGIWLGQAPSNAYQILDHVQEHTASSTLTYERTWFWSALSVLFGSGLRTGSDNALALPSHTTMDATAGYRFSDAWGTGRIAFDVLNVTNTMYPITIANGYNGSHYAAGRQYFVRFMHTL